MTIDDQVTAAVGENVDAVLTLDMRGYGVARLLYPAAREREGGPLAMAAARALAERVKPGDAVLLGTGFVFPPHNKGELDGFVGTAVVAHALEAALQAVPVIVTEARLSVAARELLKMAGLNVYDDPDVCRSRPHSAAVAAFTEDEGRAPAEAEALLDRWRPAAVAAIEKPGRNSRGVYHMGNGTDVTAMAAKYDDVFAAAVRRGVLTVAVGDLGNEIGFGAIRDTVKARIPFAAKCQCPCQEGLAAEAAADKLVIASVSDWGAYGLAACLAYVSGRAEALCPSSVLATLFHTAVASDLIDGSGYAIPSVDGVPVEDNCRLLELLAALVSRPVDGKVHFRRMFEEVAALSKAAN